MSGNGLRSDSGSIWKKLPERNTDGGSYTRPPRYAVACVHDNDRVRGWGIGVFLLLEQGDSNKRDTAFVSFLAVGRYRFAALPGGKGRVFFRTLPERKSPGCL